VSGLKPILSAGFQVGGAALPRLDLNTWCCIFTVAGSTGVRLERSGTSSVTSPLALVLMRALALVLARITTSPNNTDRVTPVAVVALSPVTDLTLSGSTWKTHAAADPYFTEPQARELVRSYLNGADPMTPKASALYGDLSGLPPIRIHVGDDEVLLDDAMRYVTRAAGSGTDARVDVWQGMPHGFVSGVGKMAAADGALAEIGAFLAKRLE
jgi:epsilon-lactone hydrolase